MKAKTSYRRRRTELIVERLEAKRKEFDIVGPPVTRSMARRVINKPAKPAISRS